MTSVMKRLLFIFLSLFSFAVVANAQDIVGGLEPIGAITGFSRSDQGITFNCQDKSEVRLYILAPDLIRVRASFKKALPARDHSWAIAKTDWDSVRWNIQEQPDGFIITTDELEVVVHRSPLLIEFRDARNHQTINSDERPMMSDAHGVKREMMFDPSAGTFIAATKKLGFEEHFYGLGEKAAHLDRRRAFFKNWNADTPAYAEGTDPIYQTVPFYLGLQRGAAYGIFFDNSYRSYFDFGHSSQRYAAFAAEGGEMNYYFFWGPSIKKILGRYADLTGHMPMPPLWALGNQQSRWSYYPDTLVEEVVRRYREEDLPLDVIHLDIDYMQDYRVFTWNRERFPDPDGLINRLGQQGVKVVTIVDPGVKYQPPSHDVQSQSVIYQHIELTSQDRNYYVFNGGFFDNYFQKRKNGQLFIAKVWPGESVFVDFTLENARRWWGDLHRAYTDHGVAGIWNDMNEPSDFVDQTGKNQMDVVSYDEGENSTHAKNRNVFALLEARATYEGLERLQPDRRPYIITRAGYAGIQRYSTMWTGDTVSNWETLALSVPVFQSLGLSGEIFVGSDVGGFIGRGNGELLTRAYEVSFLAPFCRNHKVIDGYDQEPWRFGKYYEDVIRKYLKLRYRLLPFLYTTLEEGHRTGLPLFRPLVLNYQTDESVLNLDDEFMVGSDLLVAPVFAANQTSRMVYLPVGAWYDYWTGRKISGGTMIRADAPLETVPVYVRAGSIIPLWPQMNHVGERAVDQITFEIYTDDGGHASTTLYEDDGTSPAYMRGAFRRTSFDVARQGSAFQIKLNTPQGNYQPSPRNFLFRLRTNLAPRQVTVDGRPLLMVSDQRKQGWSREAGVVAVRVTDDGRAHQILVR